MALLTDRYAAIAGVIACYDRLIVVGMLPGVCYAEGMAAYLRSQGIRLFDYARYVEPLHEEIRHKAKRLAREHGLEIAFIRSVHAFRSDLTNPSAGMRQVERLAEPIHHEERSYRGFNRCSADDLALFTALARGEWPSNGFRNSSVRRVLPHYSGPQLARRLKRVHVHGLIRKVRHTYKYYLTHTGQQVVLTALKLRELVVIPSLAGLLPAVA